MWSRTPCEQTSMCCQRLVVQYSWLHFVHTACESPRCSCVGVSCIMCARGTAPAPRTVANESQLLLLHRFYAPASVATAAAAAALTCRSFILIFPPSVKYPPISSPVHVSEFASNTRRGVAEKSARRHGRERGKKDDGASARPRPRCRRRPVIGCGASMT